MEVAILVSGLGSMVLSWTYYMLSSAKGQGIEQIRQTAYLNTTTVTKPIKRPQWVEHVRAEKDRDIIQRVTLQDIEDLLGGSEEDDSSLQSSSSSSSCKITKEDVSEIKADILDLKSGVQQFRSEKGTRLLHELLQLYDEIFRKKPTLMKVSETLKKLYSLQEEISSLEDHGGNKVYIINKLKQIGEDIKSKILSILEGDTYEVLEAKFKMVCSIILYDTVMMKKAQEAYSKNRDVDNIIHTLKNNINSVLQEKTVKNTLATRCRQVREFIRKFMSDLNVNPNDTLDKLLQEIMTNLTDINRKMLNVYMSKCKSTETGTACSVTSCVSTKVKQIQKTDNIYQQMIQVVEECYECCVEGPVDTNSEVQSILETVVGKVADVLLPHTSSQSGGDGSAFTTADDYSARLLIIRGLQDIQCAIKAIERERRSTLTPSEYAYLKRILRLGLKYRKKNI